MPRCNRCEYRADDLADHARETGHWLCIVCRRRSLTEHERQTCALCLGRVRADLADIATGYALLEPRNLTALTLLGDGTMQRHAHRYELDEGVRDEWDSDPLPVIPTLASWEDFLREHYRDPKGPPNPTLTDVVGYLTRNLDTGHKAAQTFPAFDELAAGIRQLRSTVTHAAGLADDPVAAPASCFDCGGRLLRTYGDTGLTDDWTCEGCRGVYDQASYFLALRAHHAEAKPEWRPPTVAAWLVDRPFRTLQTWMRLGVVASVCHTVSRRQLVWMPDVKAASDATARQDRRTA